MPYLKPKAPVCDICHGRHGEFSFNPCGHKICKSCMDRYQFGAEPENTHRCPYDNYKQFIRDCKAPFMETKKNKKQTTKLKLEIKLWD